MNTAPSSINPGKAVSGFLDFVREQGVIGLAIGFILGGAVAKVVAAIVTDIVDPLIGLLLGSAKGLEQIVVGPFKVGNLLSVTIDSLTIAAVVYVFVVGFGLEKKFEARETAKDELKEAQKDETGAED